MEDRLKGEEDVREAAQPEGIGCWCAAVGREGEREASGYEAVEFGVELPRCTVNMGRRTGMREWRTYLVAAFISLDMRSGLCALPSVASLAMSVTAAPSSRKSPLQARS